MGRRLSPVLQKADFIWRWDLYKQNQVRMKLLGWVPTQYNWSAYKKEEIWTQACPQWRIFIQTQGKEVKLFKKLMSHASLT